MKFLGAFLLFFVTFGCAWPRISAKFHLKHSALASQHQALIPFWKGVHLVPKPVVTHKSLLLKKKALLHHKAASIHAFAPRLINLGGQSLSNKVNLAGDQVVSVGDSLKKIGDRIQDKAIAIKAATGLLAAKFTTARPAPCKTYVAQQQEQVQQQQHEIEPQQRQDLELQQHEAETQQQQQQSFVRRRRQINPNKKQHSELQRLLRLVRQNKAEGCLQRVLCELSVDNNVHGPEGLKFGEAIKKQFGDLKLTEVSKYRNAANLGAQSKSLAKCSQRYDGRCNNIKSAEVISMGNSVLTS